ncbi:proline-rich protein 7 [Megalops cyprinoides]|uniref:proline-rich protein 7 n=1 Tax=Megalops cyprinoides TaxID=118141 RepID=UPI0018650BA4|nr:proline-rich protein 7 [Megalops cyprinoides]
MVMSQGTYTFLACFAGFWLVWALIVMLCCFCSFVQRRLKRRREERLRDRCLRTLEMEPLEYGGYPPRDPPHGLPPPHPHPQGPHALPPPSNWAGPQEADVFGKPPCYEEAVLMEDPPPPYSEVLADTRGGTYTKPASGTSRKQQDSKTSKTAQDCTFLERPYSSLIHLPVEEHWDSLGRLLSTMDLNRHNLPVDPQASALAAVPREGRTNSELGLGRLQLDQTCALPTAFPLFGRSTAV